MNENMTLYIYIISLLVLRNMPRSRAAGVLGKSTIPPQARKLYPGIVNKMANGSLAINHRVCLDTKKCLPWCPVTLFSAL